MEPIEESMEGRGTLQTKSVYVAGFEPLMKVAGTLGIDRLSKQTIKDLSIIYKIKDGKAIVDPFDIELEGIESTVWGNTSFDGEMDYWMEMNIPFEKLPSQVSGQANKLTGLINDKLGTNLSAGTKIPVKLHITGTIENPNVMSDVKSSAKNTTENIIENVKEEVKQEVQEVIDNTKEEALKKAQEEADQILKKAQEEADQLVQEADKQAYRIRKEGYDQAQALEDEAKGMLEKAAAKVAADKLRKETDNTADKVKEEARKKADQIMQRAQQEADKKLQSVEQ
jgi:vacuolar-type H+-ATPase subunit H